MPNILDFATLRKFFSGDAVVRWKGYPTLHYEDVKKDIHPWVEKALRALRLYPAREIDHLRILRRERSSQIDEAANNALMIYHENAVLRGTLNALDEKLSIGDREFVSIQEFNRQESFIKQLQKERDGAIQSRDAVLKAWEDAAFQALAGTPPKV